jgi:hypothetical protein
LGFHISYFFQACRKLFIVAGRDTKLIRKTLEQLEIQIGSEKNSNKAARLLMWSRV